MTNEMTSEEAIQHIRDIICENNSIAPNIVIFELEKEALDLAIKALEQQEDIKTWLSSFNTDSATECFTAVNNLKEKINGKW